MASTDPLIDEYIADANDFARPVLEHLRKLVHKGCPGVAETIKWRMPFFDYNGAPLCNISGFKQHCAFGFWNASLLKDPESILHVRDKNSMGHLDRITSLKDLPSDKILISLVKEAAALNEQGIKKPTPASKNRSAPKGPRKELARSCRAGGGPEKKQKGCGYIRGFRAFPPAGIYRMDRGGKNGGDAGQAGCHYAGMAGGREIKKLEIQIETGSDRAEQGQGSG